MAEKHTITIAEMRSIIVTEVLASAVGRRENKKLFFEYDIGRKRLTYVVTSNGHSDQAFDALEEAVAAYNDA